MKTKEEWLEEMELRLKRGFLDVAELNEEEGRRFLSQEIRSHLEEVAGETTRREYLLSLRDRFPLLLHHASKLTDETIREMCQSTGGADTGLSSPEAALELVRREWANLPQDAREVFLRECSLVEKGSPSAPAPDAGAPAAPAPTTGATEPPETSTPPAASRREESLEEPSAELARFLKLAMEAPLSSERMQEIFVSLLKTVSQVDALGTQVYKQLQMSRDVTQKDLRKMVGDYVTGTTMDAAELHSLLDESRIKVGLIISTIASLPETLSQTHLSKFQPALIEQMVGGGGVLRGKEGRCWKKYVTLSADLQPQKLEKAINDLLVAQLKKLKRHQ